MNRKLTIVILTLLLIGLGGFMLQRSQKPPVNSQQIPRDTKLQAQHEAINQAKQYKPDRMCTQSLVPAVHTATGAKYTFSNGCLAPGWVAETSIE